MINDQYANVQENLPKKYMFIIWISSPIAYEKYVSYLSEFYSILCKMYYCKNSYMKKNTYTAIVRFEKIENQVTNRSIDAMKDQ